MSTPAFSIKAADLVRAMSRVSGAIPSRTTIPILNHVEITARDGEITIRATSMELEAMTSVEADVARPGVVTVHGQMLAAIASKMPKAGTITIDIVDSVAKLKCGRSSYDLATLPADDFPARREPDASAARIVIDAPSLHRIVSATINSTSTDASRIYLNGIHLTSPKTDGIIVAVATDGHELVKATAHASGSKLPPNVIVPTAAAKLIRDVADDGDVTITLDDRRIMATAGANTVTASLLEGSYPDFERVIPAPNGAFATVIADDLSSATDRAMAVFTGSIVNGNRILVSAGDDGLAITASGPSNSALERVEAECANHAFACDGTKLKGLLAYWGEKSIMMQQNGPGAPILIRCEADPTTTQVLMPMK